MASVTPILLFDEIEPAMEFYRDRLGFENRFVLNDEESGKAIHAELSWDGADVMFGRLNDGDTGPVGHGVLFYFTTEGDIDAYYEELRGAGVTVAEEIADQFYGHRTFSILDPYGYQLYFAKPLN